MTHSSEIFTMLTVGSNCTMHSFPVNSTIIKNALPHPNHMNSNDMKKAFFNKTQTAFLVRVQRESN